MALAVGLEKINDLIFHKDPSAQTVGTMSLGRKEDQVIAGRDIKWQGQKDYRFLAEVSAAIRREVWRK